MAIATTLQNYIIRNGVQYDLITHSRSTYSAHTAAAAHIPGNQLAKSVILEDENGYIMAVVPATRHVEVGKLSKQLKRRLALATEKELRELFRDCDPGAVPPVGAAYGMETVIDDSLTQCPEIYFEGGSHEDLIHLTGDAFQQLQKDAKHGSFSRQI